MISPEWFNDDDWQTPLIACLIDERTEVSPDLSSLLSFYDVNEKWPHWSLTHNNRVPWRTYDDELPVFWLLDKHLSALKGTGGPPSTEEWILPRLQILVQHGVDFNVHRRDEEKPYPYVTTPLYIAMVHIGSCRLANIMIENGAKICFQCSGYEPIVCSLIKRQWWNPRMDVVRFALEKGAYPNECDEDGLTPLIIAIRDNLMCAVCALLNNGADPLMGSQPIDDLFDEYVYDTSPLEMACARGYRHCLLECLWHIEKIGERDNRNPLPTYAVERPLLLACAWGGLSCLEPLLELHMAGERLHGCWASPNNTQEQNEDMQRATDARHTDLLLALLNIACKMSRTDIIMYLVKLLKADNK